MTNAAPGVAPVFAAAAALKSRKEDVNKLNVFPVPDGDTGTNMSLTMDAVVAELGNLEADALASDVCKAITHASLMGARGNSGVILSQILRGLCDVAGEEGRFDSALLAEALARSVTVAFQAVRKPVEGTMLTVLKDAAQAAKSAADQGVPIEEALALVSASAFDSVRRTPELLPVLKENGVVDAGGLGLAILAEGFSAAVLGQQAQIAEFGIEAPVALRVEPEHDWDDQEYLYCTEFLLFGDGLDRDAVLTYVEAVGGSELVVGDGSQLKVHVHTDDPGSVLAHMTSIGEVAEVHVNNMRRQTAERSAQLRADSGDAPAEDAPDSSAATGAKPEAPVVSKPVGFVTVAAGQGLKDILASLGADVVVNGGQTMNPSTKELLDAVNGLATDGAIILPNNKNIVMTAQQVVGVAERPVVVVPTHSVPEAFAALLAYDGGSDLAASADAMIRAAAGVRTGEVTTAVKDAVAKIGAIKSGQVIGIAADEIECAGDSVLDVAVDLATMIVGDAETLTVLAGEDLNDETASALESRLRATFPLLEVETHRGDQPLYPVILAAE